MSGYIICMPEGGGIDFADCTPVINPTLEGAQGELAEWYSDVPGAAVYRLVKVEP